MNRAHRIDDLRHRRAALLRDVRRGRRERVRLARVVGVLLNGRGQLLHRRRGFLERRRLLLGARGQVEIAARDLPGCGRDRVGAHVHLAHDLREAVAHRFHRVHEAHFVTVAHADRHAQVARGDHVRRVSGVARLAAELAHDAARDQPRGHHARHQRERAEHEHPRAAFFVGRLRVQGRLLVLLLLQRLQLARERPPFRLHRAEFEAQQLVRIVLLPRENHRPRTCDEAVGGIALLAYLFEQRALLRRAVERREHRREPVSRLPVELRLRVDPILLDLHFILPIEQDQVAQRERALGNAQFELRGQLRLHAVYFGDLDHPAFELRHPVQCERDHHRKQTSDQREADPEAGGDLHVCESHHLS
ncbi:hypothetical protein X949_5395 [Burkholderia pseudomallei MSHR5609]|nr:hypothetical protein X949_5395 [Burkholderia pseudomallei MSHR5609]